MILALLTVVVASQHHTETPLSLAEVFDGVYWAQARDGELELLEQKFFDLKQLQATDYELLAEAVGVYLHEEEEVNNGQIVPISRERRHLRCLNVAVLTRLCFGPFSATSGNLPSFGDSPAFDHSPWTFYRGKVRLRVNKAHISIETDGEYRSYEEFRHFVRRPS